MKRPKQLTKRQREALTELRKYETENIANTYTYYAKQNILRILNTTTRVVYRCAGLTYYPKYVERPNGDICRGCAFFKDSVCSRKEIQATIPNEKYTERCYEQPIGNKDDSVIWERVDEDGKRLL